VAVCLYELVRDGKAVQQAQSPKPATAAEIERVTTLLLDALRTSGYLKPHRAVPTEVNVRRLVRRLHLSTRDVEFWLGILRQIMWKMEAGGGRAANH
jgi:tRNA C32,U32 (ribose-2'-O)-methylase TrmJ